MIGLGRAVGETMIVLMATGNTPIMDLNIFEGMRTFAANIAVELPESEVNSTHYRILFLTALVLFLITFAFGYGLHRCMGNRLARDAVAHSLGRDSAARFRHVEVVGEPVRVRSNFVRGYAGLPVKLHVA